MKRLALGVAVSLSATGAFAQTWNSTTNSPSGRNWFTAGNWTGGVPGSLGTATFGSGKTTTVTIGTDTATLQSVTVTGNNYNFTGAGSIVLANGGSITNNATGTRFNNVKLAGSSATFDGTGTGTVLSTLVGTGSSNLNINGNYTLAASPSGIASINVASGVSTGTLSLDGVASPDLSGIDVTVGNGGTLNAVGADPNTSAIAFYTGNLKSLQVGNGATLGARIGDVSNHDSFNPLSSLLGSTSTLSLSFVAPQTYNVNDRFEIIKPTAPGSITGSFGNVTSTGIAGLSWTKIGDNWSSGDIGSGKFFQYQNATGELVVVPEPSTLVFAGVGVAMAGWSAWKKRRLAKVLASN